MNKAKQSGFTIVELLVVIVIIGILATIGFVTFANAQNRAKQSEVESAIAQVKAKLGEYYALNNNYPVDEAAVVTYLDSTNNGSTADKLDGTTITDSVITYSAGPSGCDNSATNCDTFTLTGDASYWGGGTNISVTP